MRPSWEIIIMLTLNLDVFEDADRVPERLCVFTCTVQGQRPLTRAASSGSVSRRAIHVIHVTDVCCSCHPLNEPTSSARGATICLQKEIQGDTQLMP